MITPGKVLYSLYHKPIEIVRKTLKTGVRRTIETNAGKSKMTHAASNLQEITRDNKPTYQVYFLTGKKYWFQTAFCLYSFQKNADVNIEAIIVDDGSFEDELEMAVKRQFPTTVKVIRTKVIDEFLDKVLPVNEFPVLRQRRLDYPHLRKLTDVHVLPGDDPKLVLDSDMLFFHKPEEMLDWLANPDKCLFMKDVTESYGYTQQLMKELAGVSMIPDRLNVGVAGIPSSLINWQRLERWTKEMLDREGSSYLQEQALTAMIAADKPCVFLDQTNYKVLPVINSANIPEVLHHYVADSKYDYFVKGWTCAVN
ncbi:MAG: glycosyl transferase [Flavobacterium sp.]|nr:MAG: glycosyl transferase [Flavobacterium sp.]